MSITTTSTKDSYVGNGTTSTPYPITFKYLENSHITVYVDDVAISDSYYTLTGDGSAGTGQFTTSLEYTPSQSVVVVLDVPFDQPTALQETGALPASTLEESFDRLNMQIRRVWRKVQNTLTFSTGEGGTGSTGTADNLLGFDSSGDLTEIPNSKFCETANNLSDVDASTARTNLGVDPAGTDNSTDVTLAGSGTYISVAGQVITADPITESDVSDLGSYIENVTGEPLSDLSDVTITTPSSGEVLSWNGSAWVNSTTDSLGNMLESVYDPTTVAGDAFDASNHAYTPAGTGAVDTDVETKLRESVSVKDFGAVGDGVADDTAAIQLALDTSFKKVTFPNGTFRITAGLISSLASREIISEGGVIFADTDDIAVLTVSGNGSTVSVNIDGNNKGRQGVVVTGSQCLVEGCDIQDLYGTTLGADGIRATTSGGVIIRGNRIVGVNALTNATLGDSAGACRAVILNTIIDATAPSVIEGNYCESITGEEGDTIQVLASSGAGAFLKAYATIRGNTIKDFNRRAIKVQAHNVDVVGNTCISTLAAGLLTNAVAVVDVIQSNDVNVSRNIMECGTEFIGIYGNGGVGAECNRLNFDGNVINTTSTTEIGVFLDYVLVSSVNNNTIGGGRDAIAAQNSTSCSIVQNKFTGGLGSDADILVLSSCQEFVIANNAAMAGTRALFVENSARDSVLYGNANLRAATFNGITLSPAPTYDLSQTGTTAAAFLWTPYTMPTGVPAGTRIKGHILIRPTLTVSTSAIRVFVDDDQISGVIVPNGTTLAEITFEVVFTGATSQRGWITCQTSTGTFTSSYGTAAKSNAAELPIKIEVQNGSGTDTMAFTVAQCEVIG